MIITGKNPVLPFFFLLFWWHPQSHPDIFFLVHWFFYLFIFFCNSIKQSYIYFFLIVQNSWRSGEMFKACINPLETLGIDVYVLTNALFFNQLTSDAVVQLLLAGVQSSWQHARPAVFINLTNPSPINCQSLNSAKYPMIHYLTHSSPT